MSETIFGAGCQELLSSCETGSWHPASVPGTPASNTATVYTGTVQFTSSDGRAMLPPDAAFSASDHGSRAFPITLKTAGNQTVTATDRANSSLHGNTVILVIPAAAASLGVIEGQNPVVAGSPFDVTVTAYDPYGNVATGCRDTRWCPNLATPPRYSRCMNAKLGHYPGKRALAIPGERCHNGCRSPQLLPCRPDDHACCPSHADPLARLRHSDPAAVTVFRPRTADPFDLGDWDRREACASASPCASAAAGKYPPPPRRMTAAARRSRHPGGVLGAGETVEGRRVEDESVGPVQGIE